MSIELSDVIAFASLFVSVGAAYFAKTSSNAANKISKENLDLQHGMVELEMRQAIENAKSKVNEISVVMAPLVAREGGEQGLSIEDAKTLEIYQKNFNASVQTLMNTYDDACSKYIDGKVDKIRFKKNYRYEIRNLLENKDLKEYFDPLTSRYKPILNVYTEWENME
ncbi:hypothetical protein V9657_004456 [Vibrio vulnificus]|uniref:hypothetical protein n=1 Tax=Vibrio TaxID=662 RepID=UPI001EEE434E|nr:MULTISPECIES: hypothetical protein [Vibrio]ELG4788259.1 hypothetical protein [Vibrio vulnificus]MDK2603002.1 hypothetical protein [Vibrio vulnificus]MDK2719525.1 hypothetical protein [Vibrio vulnificus]ULF83746.1 hypothetical protein K6750_06570 [Vibrio alginolyticus]